MVDSEEEHTRNTSTVCPQQGRFQLRVLQQRRASGEVDGLTSDDGFRVRSRDKSLGVGGHQARSDWLRIPSISPRYDQLSLLIQD